MGLFASFDISSLTFPRHPSIQTGAFDSFRKGVASGGDSPYTDKWRLNMDNQPETPVQFLDLQGQPAIVSFLAMEYYAVILNRSFAVIVTKNTICGAKVFGAVGSPRTAIGAYLWRDPRNFIGRKTLEKYHSVDPESSTFLTISKDNFQIPCSSVKGIGFTSRKKMSMGNVPHSGSLFVHLADGRKKELILLGNQDGEEIERLMLTVCPSASRM
jgi:hypothetical protein